MALAVVAAEGCEWVEFGPNQDSTSADSVLPYQQMPIRFLWDSRPGRNLEHIAEHGMTSDLWEEAYHRATRHGPDKDDPTVTIAEGQAQGRLYRIIYSICDDGSVIPLTILPITGFPIERRALR
jgi:hypothetical protein